MTPLIKPEPQESRIYPSGRSQGLPEAIADDAVLVKSEVNDAARVFLDRGLPAPFYDFETSAASTVNSENPAVAKREGAQRADAFARPVEPKKPLYTIFEDASQIMYQPEDALSEGSSMVKTLKNSIRGKLKLGKLREEVWLREIESLQAQGAPTTMIAVCGATGAGKSSVLNAILDDNIVPTSGMRACTAVVTEISYHAKKTIEGDVSFLSEAEWRQELTVLLDDLVDEDGNLKRSTDLRSDAGVAWQKVHAVYPSVSPEQLTRMSIEQIIALDQNIARILGTTKHIVANGSKAFAKAIGKFIDSKDQKRGDRSKKDKAKEKEKKEKEKGKSLIEKMREQNKSKNASLGIGTTQGPKSSKVAPEDDPDGPAYWPLIRQVQVKCNAKALSTGAILVDLPGVADANAARNNIAKDYMKKCDCIWILAPITRAVDDKTARDLMGDAFKMQLMMDGNYDDNAITFIATKCDDISCSEVIRALRLEDDPELQRIEDEIDTCDAETDDWKAKKADAEANAKATDQVLKQLRPQLAEYEDHLRALRNGEPFTPKLTAKKKSKAASDGELEESESEEEVSPRSKKRKNQNSRGNSSKRRRSGGGSDDDDFFDDDDELVFSDSDSDHERSSDDGSATESSSESEDSEDEDAMDEDITEESLKIKIQEVQDNIKQGRIDLSEYRRLRKEASDAISALKKRQIKAQREKNAFCSLKRSEFSRDVLKEDFRRGLKDLDDAAAEQKDPDNFDPTQDIRDYNAINLPVFTCSSRDYVRLKGQVQGDGDPTCFSKVEDTGIPALQDWCHHLTVASRERAARNFLTHLRSFTNSVKVYLDGSADVTQADREALKDAWESVLPDDNDDNGIFGAGWEGSDDFLNLPGLAMLADPLGGGGLYSMNRARREPKVDRFGELIGVTPRLVRDFADVVEDCVEELKSKFQDGLAEKCRLGAVNAASAAVETSDNFAASMHWATYRATLRRHGSWRQDLNVELSNPFTRQIASTWSQVFEADLFGGFEKAANDTISQLLKEIEESAAPGLKDRARLQGELAREEANVALKNTIDIVQDTISTQQKEVSRCLAPHVQNQLFEGYGAAMEERGRGSVARQKAVFHREVNEIKNEMFDDAADVILGRLAETAEAVGKALGEALEALAKKVEVSVAVLWEGSKDSPEEAQARTEVIDVVQQIAGQVQLWQSAAQAANQYSA